MEDRQELIGKVVGCKTNKTITVLIETHKMDKKYGKRKIYSKKYAVHDDKNVAKLGDIVRIAETRPLSKTKHYRLIKVVEEAVIL